MTPQEVIHHFKSNPYIRRAEIHRQFGGNGQSGFSSSRKVPIIFVFTSAAGSSFGYEDGLKEDGYLHIAGEGQVGDMKFDRGNKAVRDHKKNGRTLLYFEESKGSQRHFVGELECVDHYEKELRDKNNKLRRGIIFRFNVYDKENLERDQKKFEQKYREGVEQRVVQTTRERNPQLRKDAISHYGSICMVCQFDFNHKYGKDIASDYIEVHHLKMLANSRGERETSVKDVIVVCSNCHRMIHSKKPMLDWERLKTRVNP